MLTLTENATTIVKQIAQSTEEQAALRISMETAPEAGFGITLSHQPEPGDEVVEQEGATVYLESQAADLLTDQVLDAGVDGEGNVQFALSQQV